MPTSISNEALFAAPSSKRIESIDLLRGIVIIIMALDHVRDYFHASAFLFNPTDPARTSIYIFFTRWITHFCAPVFVFLAGTSARLQLTIRSRKELSVFLFTRGLWLVLAEITIVTFGWLFNPHFGLIILQVIFAIGISMIFLSVLLYLPDAWILAMALLLMAGHNLLDSIHVQGNSGLAFGWSLIHDQRFFSFGRLGVQMGYPFPPWMGLMLGGFCMGKLYLPGCDPMKRKKILIYLGWACTLGFVALRYINGYGDPAPWSTQRNGMATFFSFLNTNKYPPSLMYLLMTMGPALLFLGYAESLSNAFTRKLVIFGRVPMFFYLLHIYWIHVLAMLAAVLTGHPWTDMILTTWVRMSRQLMGYGFHLWVVYVIWIGVVVSLYPLCKWFNKYKSANRSKWWIGYV